MTWQTINSSDTAADTAARCTGGSLQVKKAAAAEASSVRWGDSARRGVLLPGRQLYCQACQVIPWTLLVTDSHSASPFIRR